MINTADKVISLALSQVGYIEKSLAAYKADPSIIDKLTEGGGSDNVTKYGKQMHDIYPSVMDFPAAWCDAFVDWCFYQAYGVANAKGLLCGDFDDYTVGSAALYKRKNAYYTQDPKKGDQIFFRNSKRICHTGLVVDVDSKRVYTVEGNTSSAAEVIPNGGMVCRKSYPLSHAGIDGYGRPKYDDPVVYPLWIQDGSDWYYRLADGVNAHGWKVINGHWYYFDESGKALTGYHKIGDERFYFETEGALQCALMHTDERGALTEWRV